MYEMNEPFFKMLIIGFTGDKAIEARVDFMNAFYFMEHELIMRKETRHLGIVEARKPLPNAIDQTVNPGKFKSFSYGNYTKLIYKHVLGTTVKKFKEKHNLPEKANIREYFTMEALQKIHIAESKIAGIIEFCESEDDKVVYEKVKEYLIKKQINIIIKTIGGIQ